jgi:hypothetical protein
MPTIGCLQCLQWYDPSRGPHICGLVADETARRLTERLDAFERRFSALEFEARRRLSDLERRVEANEVDGSRLRETKPVQNWTPVEHGPRSMAWQIWVSEFGHPRL